MKETLNLNSYNESNTLLSSECMSLRNIDELKAAQNITANNNGLVAQGFPALRANCHGFVGHACVSVHIRPVSTPSLRSVGHSPHVHGTPAQYYVATSPSLHVVQNCIRAQDIRVCAKANTIKQKPKTKRNKNESY
jgi:hypothetical protein